MPFISIIIPCRNEEKYIGKVLDNILHQDYPMDCIEVKVVDGASQDGTAEIVTGYALKFPQIELLLNPKGFVPFAMNLGIRASKGTIIVRMDAHSEYPENYLSSLIYHLNELQADNVGGQWVTTPGEDTLKAKAIAIALSHKFGVGNAMFRVGASNPIATDTVPFGCYPRRVFDKIGLFDEEMLRNQDDEFNGRLSQSGGKIYLIPDIKIIYFARSTFRKLWKLYYQYGFFKPLVNLKLNKPTNLRQFAPPAIVLFMALNLILGIWSRWFLINAMVLLLGYALVSLFTSLKKHDVRLFFYLFIAFQTLHFSYGLGYLLGSLRFLIFRTKVKQIQDNR